MTDAEHQLSAIGAVQRRSRQLARGATIAVPLVVWGLAWTASAVVVTVVASGWSALVSAVLGAGAAVVSFAVRPDTVRLGSEGRFAVGWWLLVGCTAVVGFVVAPAGPQVMVTTLCCLWATAMAVYGAVGSDGALVGVGVVTLAAAAVARVVAPDAMVLVTGVVGGGSMLLLGLTRLRWRR